MIYRQRTFVSTAPQCLAVRCLCTICDRGLSSYSQVHSGIYDSGWESSEHLLLSRNPSPARHHVHTRTEAMPEHNVHRVLSSRLGPVDPSSRALSGRLKFTVRRQKFNKESLIKHNPRSGLRWILLCNTIYERRVMHQGSGVGMRSSGQVFGFLILVLAMRGWILPTTLEAIPEHNPHSRLRRYFLVGF